VFRGATMWMLGGQNIGPFPKEFQAISSGFLPDLSGINSPHGLTVLLVVLIVLTVLYAFFTENTTMGRRIYAVGGNEKAAKLSGINSDRLVFACFVNMGVLAALAGMMVTARLNSATPKAGTGFELDAIASVFIGGASMTGGSGKIVGVVIGALIMGVMNMGMSIMGIGIDYQQMIKGLVLLAAVIFDVYNKAK
ncbi:MAG: sugar ABC transporter permease, partial [Cypionkella sp.]|nr:sugar ABC transporter permease [Cypionkella sp.]